MYVCASYVCSVHGDQKKMSDLLEMELHTVMSHLVDVGNQTQVSLINWAVSPALLDCFCTMHWFAPKYTIMGLIKNKLAYDIIRNPTVWNAQKQSFYCVVSLKIWFCFALFCFSMCKTMLTIDLNTKLKE